MSEPTKASPGRQPLTDAQIVDMFTYHNDPNNLPKFAAINQACIELVKVIRDNCPMCPDQSAAIRLVREARMTANASIACEGRY